MVATQYDTRSDAAAVAGRAAELYRANGSGDATVTTLSDLAPGSALGSHIAAVTVESGRIVELVLGAGVEPGGVAADVRALVDEDWSVTVLVPSSRLGLAHAALRRSGCMLQSWWRLGEAIAFGTVEIP